MNKNFLVKLGLILGTVLFFLFGIFGIPKGFSRQAILDAVGDHIHLGLDLKGGTHLILQVQVNDAVNVVAQNAIEVLKDQLRTRKIDYSDINQPDQQNNPDHVVIKGMPPSGRSDLLTIVHDRLPDYDVNGGPDNSWNLAMKPASLSELKTQAVRRPSTPSATALTRWASANPPSSRTDSANTRFSYSFPASTIPVA